MINAEEAMRDRPVHLALSSVKPCPFKLRLEPPNMEHVEVLAQLGGNWPPILVSAEDHSVIDGQHRFLAAKRLGLSQIDCYLFAGSRDAAFLEALRLNALQGLPLTLRERETAAERVIECHSDWSDRRIASLCGLSPTTIGRLRLAMTPRPAVQSGQLDVRVGRDQRVRPLDSEAMRKRVTAELEARPSASLREIASIAHCSPETVRSVRKSLGQAVRPLPVALPEPRTEGDLDGFDQPERVDRALMSTIEGAAFKRWFDTTFVDEEACQGHVLNVPLSRVYEIADLAVCRSEAWRNFARALEARVKTARD